MNNLQRSVHDSIKRFLDVCVRNATKVAGTIISDFPVLKARLVGVEAGITAAGTVQTANNTGAVQDNNDAKYEMAKITVKYGLKGAVKARLAGENKLAEQLGYHVNYIKRAPKKLAVERAKAIRNTLNSNLTLFTGITAANITAIDDAITAFELIETEPVSLIETKKATGTEALPPL
ncbi:MAG: hypothetical protein WCQ95_11330 [Bacteroidota bacterium]